MDLNNTIYYLNREQEESHTQERAAGFNLPYMDLGNYPIVKEVINLVPEQKAVELRAIPYLKIGNELKVAVVNPNETNLKSYIDELEKKEQVKVTFSIISDTSFVYGLSVYESYRLQEANKNLAVTQKKNDQAKIDISNIKSAAEAAKKATTTKLLDVLLIGAMKLGASDIHFEPSEENFLTRYRVDGVLQDVVELPLNQFKQLVSRIKYMSKLRMDLVSQPQDGRFSFKDENGIDVDFRVSIMPSANGEAIVLRLLGQEKSILKLDLLGLHPEALSQLRDAITKPHGMILTSGPTGSGKSSTLYAILMELKKPGIKIITLEDPVEYKIDGIEQSQVKPVEGYTFAEGLRASLRQDPDILMVGEVRDQETAEIAVQSALTGHLLLSTIHANSAPAVYARLLEIGVKPFLLSGSINLIMAQRLVRKICPFCMEERLPQTELWQNIISVLDPIKDKIPGQIKLPQSPIPLKHSKGCERCNFSGYNGRQIIIEVLTPNDQVESLIVKSASIHEFEKVAKEMGMITMEQDGLIKVLQGITTVEEVWRVTRG